MLRFWEFIITCGHKKVMHFSDESKREWSNLFLWEGSWIQNGLPPISDRILRITMFVEENPVFVVWTATHFQNDVGEILNTCTRKTRDPIELKLLLESSPRGKTLYNDLIQTFSEDAFIRINNPVQHV